MGVLDARQILVGFLKSFGMQCTVSLRTDVDRQQGPSPAPSCHARIFPDLYDKSNFLKEHAMVDINQRQRGTRF